MPGSLAAGQLVDERYALDEPLGEDSLGTVWRAYDRGLERQVVVRDVHFPGGLFQAEPARLQEALTAARIAIRLDHPGAVHVYDAFVVGDHLVVVTELVTGRSLASMVERKGAQPVKRVAAIGLDLLAPLEALHRMGLAHGTLAPTGVVVPERGRARLTELGLAPSFRDDASLDWAREAGTPSCLAPEQVRLEGTSPAADMWAFGATLYYAVEGAHAFPSAEAVGTEPPRPPSRAGALWPVLERLLVKQPADRPSPEDLRADLAAIAGVPPGGTEEPEGRRSRRDRRRGAAPEPLPTDGGPAEDRAHDWGAVVAREAEQEPAWQDWSPGEGPVASDVWLPGTDLDEPTRPVAPVASGPRFRSPADEAATWGPPEGDEAAGDGPALVLVPPPNVDAVPVAEEPDPDPAAPVEVQVEEEPRRYRSSPSWPPADSRKGPLVVGLCFLVMVVLVALLVTNGRIGGGEGSGTTVPVAQRPVLATDPASVPRDWVTYRHARADMGISYPPSWVVAEEGDAVVLRDPASTAELRIHYERSPDEDPHDALLDQERDFAARHGQNYRRLQLSPANFLDRAAALWEYTYAEGPTALHAVELNFHSDDTALMLTFRAPAATWESMLPVFHRFLSSVRPPG
ncbi:MAG: protein kinase domain-containing protein [Acidimicrobiia bacterium]